MSTRDDIPAEPPPDTVVMYTAGFRSGFEHGARCAVVTAVGRLLGRAAKLQVLANRKEAIGDYEGAEQLQSWSRELDRAVGIVTGGRYEQVAYDCGDVSCIVSEHCRNDGHGPGNG